MSVFRYAAPIAVVAGLWLVPSTGAGSEGGGGGDYGGGSGASQGLNNATTRSVVNILNRGASSCRRLPWTYKYDCYRWVYKRAADKLVGNTAYSEAYKALTDVETSLDTLVRQNRDPSQPVRRRALETYTPVKPESRPKVTRGAEQALDRAETVLLRSPASKQVHYARIADAVNSNKTLLRSALLPGGIIRFAGIVLNRLLQQT
ncbi:hypothetical protein [Pseudophaeobacter sp.]|uniref:hypothetical protein n=1 Tax=Pseudophaeobacter sp. TaxID=1971739 RepID=UPI003A96EFB1